MNNEKLSLAPERSETPADDRPILWVESEPSTRLMDLAEIIEGTCHTIMYHTREPRTDNPVWPLYTRPVAPTVSSSAAPSDERTAFEVDTADTFAAATFGRFPLSGRYNIDWVQNRWEGWQARAVLATPSVQAVAAPVAGLAVPEGWKLVPIELTDEMHAAAVRTILRCTGNDDFPPRVYGAMLAAAPAASPVELTDAVVLADPVLRYHFGLNSGAGPVSPKGWSIINAVRHLNAQEGGAA